MATLHHGIWWLGTSETATSFSPSRITTRSRILRISTRTRMTTFLLLGAEEVTNEKTVHVNAIGISRVIPAQRGSTVTELLQASIDAIRAQGAVALINHPNFRWAFTASDMLPLKGPVLLEIASGHPTVNHSGDGLVPATEQMWDQLLSAGMRVFGVAVDDAHNFRQDSPWIGRIRDAVGGRPRAFAYTGTHRRGLELRRVLCVVGRRTEEYVSTSDAVSVEIQTAHHSKARNAIASCLSARMAVSWGRLRKSCAVHLHRQ